MFISNSVFAHNEDVFGIQWTNDLFEIPDAAADAGIANDGGNQGKLTSIHFFFPFPTSLTPPKAIEISSLLLLATAQSTRSCLPSSSFSS
ncbi:hypothetical protein PG996_007741 [Apiospora saccharicola]|uniref:Uncharacterized protein n=1 Tax=Apiospora saccharicola TaxID=335842 RepID=A0ABR1VF75_9PEZI